MVKFIETGSFNTKQSFYCCKPLQTPTIYLYNLKVIRWNLKYSIQMLITAQFLQSLSVYRYGWHNYFCFGFSTGWFCQLTIRIEVAHIIPRPWNSSIHSATSSLAKLSGWISLCCVACICVDSMWWTKLHIWTRSEQLGCILHTRTACGWKYPVIKILILTSMPALKLATALNRNECEAKTIIFYIYLIRWCFKL